MTTVLSTIQDLQTRSLEQLRSTQEQVLSYNEQLAETVVGAMPSMGDLPTPLASLPTPVEMAETYFSFVSDLYEANKDFTLRFLAPWQSADDAE